MAEALEQRLVPFDDDTVVAVQRPDGTIFVLLARLCQNLGLERTSQVRRIQRHSVIAKGLQPLTIQTDGGAQELQCLRLDLLPLWLSGLQASRVKAELQPKLVRYQEEAAMVLWEAFRPQLVVAVGEPPEGQAIRHLQQIAELGRAITHLAEQQIELQRQQQTLAGRVDTAALVIREVQHHLADVHIRLGVLEDQFAGGVTITEVQAAELSGLVKALAELLTGQGGGKNFYQSIFAELYRRFGVTSYKLIRQEQYGAVVDFLEDWRRSAVGA